jgi:hypothetical protein
MRESEREGRREGRENRILAYLKPSLTSICSSDECDMILHRVGIDTSLFPKDAGIHFTIAHIS